MLRTQLSSELAALLNTATGAGVFPGAVVGLLAEGVCLYTCAGRLEYSADSSRVTEEQVYDLASLTKVVATTTAVMRLCDTGKCKLSSRLAQFLPELVGDPKGKLSIGQLLSHTAGLPAPSADCQTILRAGPIRQFILQMPLAYAPGSKRIYNDWGFVFLGWVIERLASASLNSFCTQMIFNPLGMNATLFAPPSHLKSFVSPTETDAISGIPLRGEVHDEVARALGGVSGHAGLFSNARDILRFASEFFDCNGEQGKLLSVESRDYLKTPQWRDNRGVFGLGWDLYSSRYMGRVPHEHLLGHTGFTGCSLVLDYQRSIAVVFLSNRIHPKRTDRKHIDDVRRAVHEMVFN